MTTTDAGPLKSPHSKRKVSFVAEEEDIVVKPSTELIPDEYEHDRNEPVLLHIFKNNMENSITDDFVTTMESIDYTINPINQIHYFSNREMLFKDLNYVKGEAVDKSALILVFIGFLKKDGYIHMQDELGNQSDVPIKDIWNEFTSNNCLELKYKPKIFIFCTSPWPVAGVTTDSMRHRTLCFDKVYDFPAESDLLIIYHKTEDTSFLAKAEFLDQLCSNIKNYSKKYDIIDLVTHMQKSVPLIISTLTRKFYLTPSDGREHYLSIMENSDYFENSLKHIKGVVQKLHEMHKKKKENKFMNFSFKRKSEEKPKVIKRTDVKVTTIKEAPVKQKEIKSSRTSDASSVGIRSRHQSESDYGKKIGILGTSTSGAGVSGTTKKKPVWRR